MTDPRPQDQSIAEVRRNREELLRASGGSIDERFAVLKDAERKESRLVVKLSSRPARARDADAA